jgi:RHS repeat-associated protein
VRIATLDGSAAEEVERDGDGLVVARTDAAGRRVTYEYDARGNRVRAVAPTGDTVAWEYAGDLPVGRTGADGSTAKCAWDERGAPKSYTNELGVRFDYEVDGRGRLVAVDGPEGRIESYHFDEHGDVDTVVDARGGEWRYRFDPMGRVIAATDPLGRETVWQRDAIGRVIGERLPDGTELRYEHDAYDRAIAITDADGVGPRAELAPSGGVLSATTSAGERWRVERDVLERPTRLTSPKQETHRYRYDRVGRVAEETTFDGRTSRYRYDRSGRLVRVEHGDDSWEEIEHDERGYVLRRRFADATHTWERDALGRPVAAIAEDAAGRVVVEWAWSDRGLLRSEAVDGRVVEHEYDALGRRIARRLPNGEVTRYRYDPAGAVIEIGHEGARIVIERDVLGRERRRRLGVAGLSVTTEYSMDDRPSRRVLVNAEGRTLRRREWAYGPHARLVRATDDRFGTTEYEHDLRGRLVGTRRAAAGELFEYDAAGSLSGRRPRRRPAGRPFTHAKGGLLLESDRATYEYDPRGRRRRRTVAHPGGQAAVTEYAWDSADRLREVRASDGTRVRFAYDVLGRRVCKVIEAASDAGGAPRRVDFVWDGLELAMELDSSGSERSFVHAPGPFVPVLVRDAGATRYCITDRLGALGDLVDETGEIAWSGELSPWGELTRSEGAAPPPPFRLLGQYADDETGLLYVFQRWFDPEVARWLSPDPLGIDGGLGLYAFDGSPTEQVDPLGLMTRPDFEKRMNDSAGRRESAHDATERAREKLLAGEKGELADREKTVSVSSDGRTAETRDGVHAEQQIVDATKTEGSPKGDLGGEAVGASHPHCANCVNAIVGAGGVTADRISARGPDGNKDLFSPDKFPRTNGQVWGGTGGEPLGGAS